MSDAKSSASGKAPPGTPDPIDVRNGDRCAVDRGTHAGKSGTVEYRKTSKTGHVTITVRQTDGTRFKTLARNVTVQHD